MTSERKRKARTSAARTATKPDRQAVERIRREPHADLRGLPTRLADAMVGLEGKDVAETSGVDASVISRILNGRSLTGVYADTVLKLARALDVSPGWLLCGDGLKRGRWVEVERGGVS